MAREVLVPGFYEVAGKSIIRSRFSKARVFIFPARMWANMEKALFQEFATGAVVLLQEMGRTFGTQFGATLKSSRTGFVDPWEFLQSIARGSGWGDVAVERDGTSLRITVRECVFCTDAEKQDAPSCHFIVGVAKGIGEVLNGVDVVARETQCLRAGAEACIIEVQPA